MRVVIVSDFGSVNGGAAKVAIESARGLAEAGVDVVFACAIGPVSERLDHPRIEIEVFEGQEVWQVAGRFSAARQGIWNGAAHEFLAKLFARQPRGETLVHLHQWTKAFSPAAIAAAGESGLPVAITLHDYFSFCPVGGYFDFRKGEPCRLTPMSPSCIARNCDRASYPHKLVRVARQWKSDKALRALRAPLFIHVSAFARRFAEPFLPAGGRHVVVENMMEAQKRPPSDVAANHHALFLGRLTQEKGVIELARASRAAGIPLRLVGDGEEAIKRQVTEANPDAVMTGWVSGELVLRELRAARCLVAPSLWYETGPMTIIEAMANGVPPIVARHMGAAERVRDGVTGFALPDASVDALAERLTLLREAGTAARLGQAAHEAYWLNPLTLERHVRNLLSAFRDVPALAA